MKKLIILILVVVLLTPNVCFAEPTSQDFKYGDGIVFGMTMDEVQKQYGVPISRNEDKLSYMDAVTIAELSAAIDLKFDDNKLSEIILFFDLNHDENTNYTSDFSSIDTVLLQQYPDEAYTGMSVWMNEDYKNKDDEEQAVKDGALILMSDYKQSDIEVQHIIQFFEDTCVHTISFQPIK